MPFIVNAKEKAAKGSVVAAFKNEAGAIDLASIMVGIIVIGLIGGVIAATVFSVIPWSQDNAARQQLDSVAAAQSAYVSLSSNGKSATFGGVPINLGNPTANSWGASPAGSGATGTPNRLIVGNDGTVTETLFSAPGSKMLIGNYGTGADAHYVAAIRSASGARFYITDTKTQPTTYPASALNTTTSSTPSAAEVATAKMNAAINSVVSAVPA